MAVEQRRAHQWLFFQREFILWEHKKALARSTTTTTTTGISKNMLVLKLDRCGKGFKEV